jgi:hypothetical protein
MMYRVSWHIEIEADTPREAAEMARGIQLDVGSVATCFIVDEVQSEIAPFARSYAIDTDSLEFIREPILIVQTN